MTLTKWKWPLISPAATLSKMKTRWRAYIRNLRWRQSDATYCAGKKTVVADKETDDSLPDIPDLLRLLQEPEAHVSQNSLDEGLPASGREDILQEAMDIAIANSLQTEPPHTINQDNSNEPRPPLHREDENQAPAAYLTPEMAPIQQMQTPEADPRPTTTYSDAPLATYTNLGTPTVYARETTESPTAHDNLIDALFELECRSEPLQTDKANVVNVCRDDVLDGGLRAFARKNFNPANKLSVRFAGEPGIDNGGPTRDFLRLAMTAIEERYFTPDTPKHIKLKSTGKISMTFLLSIALQRYKNTDIYIRSFAYMKIEMHTYGFQEMRHIYIYIALFPTNYVSIINFTYILQTVNVIWWWSPEKTQSHRTGNHSIRSQCCACLPAAAYSHRTPTDT